MAKQEQKKPNILILWGDDIGWYNISAYNLGVMGDRTPNIDRVAREGAIFTDWYGPQSCTPGAAPRAPGGAKGGAPGRPPGSAAKGPDDRRAAQAARLCHGSVRQESP